MMRELVAILPLIFYARFSEADDVCGSLPFDPQTEYCCNDVITRPLPANPLCCGNRAVDSDIYICCAEEVLVTPCGLPACCQGNSFDGNTHLCCEGEIQSKMSPQSECCGQAAMNIVLSICCNDEINERRTLLTTCCNTTTYESDVEICCSGSVHPIPTGAPFYSCADLNPRTTIASTIEITTTTEHHSTTQSTVPTTTSTTYSRTSSDFTTLGRETDTSTKQTSDGSHSEASITSVIDTIDDGINTPCKWEIPFWILLVSMVTTLSLLSLGVCLRCCYGRYFGLYPERGEQEKEHYPSRKRHQREYFYSTYHH